MRHTLMNSVNTTLFKSHVDPQLKISIYGSVAGKATTYQQRATTAAFYSAKSRHSLDIGSLPAVAALPLTSDVDSKKENLPNR